MAGSDADDIRETSSLQLRSYMEYAIVKEDPTQSRAEIVGFWLRTFPAWSEGKFDQFYVGNPRGHAGCWIAREPEQNEVVGSIAIFPRKVLIDGQVHTVGLAGDLGVHPEHRQKGLALELRKRMIAYREEAPFGFLYGMPNERSARITVRAGYHIVGPMKRLVKLMKTRDFIERRVKIGPLASALAAPLDAALHQRSPERGIRLPEGCTLETPSVFDGRFDTLWEKASARFPLIGERTADFLNWRFMRSPSFSYRILALTETASGAVLAYIVYRQHENELHIADVFGADLEETLDAMLAQFLQMAREVGTVSVSVCYFGNDKITRGFQRFGFRFREHRRPLIVFVDDDKPYADLVRSEQNWYVFEGDNDV